MWGSVAWRTSLKLFSFRLFYARLSKTLPLRHLLQNTVSYDRKSNSVDSLKLWWSIGTSQPVQSHRWSVRKRITSSNSIGTELEWNRSNCIRRAWDMAKFPLLISFLTGRWCSFLFQTSVKPPFCLTHISFFSFPIYLPFYVKLWMALLKMLIRNSMQNKLALYCLVLSKNKCLCSRLQARTAPHYSALPTCVVFPAVTGSFICIWKTEQQRGVLCACI